MNWIRDLYAWACERLYHELAWSYDVVSWLVSAGWWSSWRTVALAYVQGRVLELGFGTGNLLCALGTAGWPAVGLELSPAMHRVTARKFAARGLTVPVVRGTALTLPFPSGAFDSVVATFPAPYILQPETLAECRRVLRPGGRLVVVGLWIAPRGGKAGMGLPIFLGRPSAGAVETLAERFRQAGFRITIHEPARGWAHVGTVIAERT